MLEFLDFSAHMGMPIDVSVHGAQIDYTMALVHWLMFILFIIWAPYFLYVLYRFRQKKQPKANYHGTKSKMSTYLEGGIVVAEVVLLFGFALPQWDLMKNQFPAEEEAEVIHVVAEQFAWNIHYPGADGVFGRRAPDLVDTALNPLGLDRDDPYAQDDIATVNELHIPVGKPIIVQLSSKDVIHSFALPVMRVKQDAIPGLTIPVWFEATETGDFEIACAQLCGIGHYRMRGYLTIHTGEEYAAWLAEQAPEPPAPPASEETEEVEEPA